MPSPNELPLPPTQATLATQDYLDLSLGVSGLRTNWQATAGRKRCSWAGRCPDPSDQSKSILGLPDLEEVAPGNLQINGMTARAEPRINPAGFLTVELHIVRRRQSWLLPTRHPWGGVWPGEVDSFLTAAQLRTDFGHFPAPAQLRTTPEKPHSSAQQFLPMVAH